MKNLCVLGLGHIGLPIAAISANNGLRVIGVDTDSGVRETLTRGEVHIQEQGLESLVQSALASACLTLSSVPQQADIFLISVPTPIFADKSADLRFVEDAATAIASHLRPGNLVLIESTCPPGTTMNLVRPILEQSGIIAGVDFHLAYSPERIMPGNALEELVSTPRTIGGINEESAEAGREFYASFFKGETFLTSATTAELVKLMENTYRDTKSLIV